MVPKTWGEDLANQGPPPAYPPDMPTKFQTHVDPPCAGGGVRREFPGASDRASGDPGTRSAGGRVGSAGDPPAQGGTPSAAPPGEAPPTPAHAAVAAAAAEGPA